MIKKEFSEIYEKFKLNFYRNIYLETEDSENNGFDLTITESFCLEVIKSLKNATVRDVAKFMRTSQPNAAYKVANLAKKGYVTRHDQKQFGAMLTIPKIYKHYRWFTNKDEAVEYLTYFRKPLDKEYTCLICTDKKYGLAEASNNYEIPFTEKQRKEVYKLSRNCKA